MDNMTHRLKRTTRRVIARGGVPGGSSSTWEVTATKGDLCRIVREDLPGDIYVGVILASGKYAPLRRTSLEAL